MKLDESALQALREGQPMHGHARYQALRGFVEALLRTQGLASDAELAAFLAAGYTHQNALEALTISAAKTLSNYANNLTGTPAEAFMSDPTLNWRASRSTR